MSYRYRNRVGKRGQRSTPTKTYRGTIQKNPRGFAFIIEERKLIPDCFVSTQEAAELMNGDTVEYNIRSGRRGFSAANVRITDRRRKQILGRTIPQFPGKIISSDNEVFQVYGTTPKLETWVLANIDRYPTGHSIGGVTVHRELGKTILPAHDIPVAVALFGLSDTFSKETLDEASNIGPVNPMGRRDLRGFPFVTIDGEDARDFDDAVYVESSRQAAFVLYVSIADVSYFVKKNSALDEDARKRGTSVYFTGHCIPMLPEALSNDLCSLKPHFDRLSLTCEILFDRDGTIQGARFYESIVRTACRLTYSEVQRFFDGESAIVTKLKEVMDPLKRMYRLYRLLNKARQSRWALDFELPECQVTLDVHGEPVSLERSPRFESHRMIEEFMIAANSAVARALRDAKIRTLYRVHDPPDAKSMEDTNQLLKNLGMAHRLLEPTAESFSKLLSSTRRIKGGHTLHQALLRAQKQACYHPEPNGHFALSLKDYTHFTSPIRRYPDLLVHRSLKGLIHRKTHSEERIEEDWASLGTSTSKAERCAMMAERFFTKRKQCRFLKKQLGRVYEGTLAWVSAEGAFVELPEYVIEGFLPIDQMAGMEPDDMRLRLRSCSGSKVVSIGDPISVLLASVELENNQVIFSRVHSR